MKTRILAYSSIFTALAVVMALPFIYFMLMQVSANFTFDNRVVFFQMLYSESARVAVVILLSCLVGFAWSKRLGLGGVGRLRDLKKHWQLILLAGVVVGGLTYVLGDRNFLRTVPELYPKSLAFAVFIPFYATFVEEVFARFGVMTTLVKIFRNKWVANFLAAFIFAIGHANIFRMTGVFYHLNYLTVCSLLVNLLIGLFFGYIYWRRGLVTAMGIHFIANLRFLLMALF